MICYYWYFKDIGYNYETNIMILNIKSVDYRRRRYVFNMNRSDAINLLNNSWLDNKGVR